VPDLCLKLLTSPDVPVRWEAATCLGDLAFLRRPLDVQVVLPALEQAAQDSQIVDSAKFSISMVRQFLAPKWKQRVAGNLEYCLNAKNPTFR
jgi:HEAT repeat